MFGLSSKEIPVCSIHLWTSHPLLSGAISQLRFDCCSLCAALTLSSNVWQISVTFCGAFLIEAWRAQ